MTHTIPRKHDFSAAGAAILTASLLVLSTSAGVHGQPLVKLEPFACNGEAFVSQASAGTVSRIDQTEDPFVFLDAGDSGGEFNNIGFRSTDGFLYGLRLTFENDGSGNGNGNLGVIRVGRNLAVESLGVPVDASGNPLPTTGVHARFDAGDVSSDGTTMYVNHAGRSPLFLIDLASFELTEVAFTGDGGAVHDWAYHPDFSTADAMLFGGDDQHGQVAILDPAAGTRADLDLVDTGLGDLPTGIAYGGAWFNGAGRLFLYRNNGEIYEIDLAVPTIVSIQKDGPSSVHNDGAACIPENPDPCRNDPIILQDGTCKLFDTDALNVSFAAARPVCQLAPGQEVNNAGYRRTDGLVYGLELTSSGNAGLVSIDPKTCELTALGFPAGLTAYELNHKFKKQRFDAGDVSSDGRWLFVNRAGIANLFYRIDLTSPSLEATRMTVVGSARGFVHDWAFHPADGKLYGADDGLYESLGAGQLAVVAWDPDRRRWVRRDADLVDTGLGVLPSGVAYGGAWFNGAGHLVVHRNRADGDGNSIYEIDLEALTIISKSPARSSQHNDGTACAPLSPVE